MIQRILKAPIISSIKPGFVVGLFGARRTGKTFLMTQIRDSMESKNILMVNGENLDAAEILSSSRKSTLEKFIAGYQYLFVDEAQKIPDIGVNLKLLVDTVPGVSVFITGSSALDLKGKIGEPLTGRSRYFYLYPFAQLELEEDFMQAKENLEQRLIYGMYPQVVMETDSRNKQFILENIRDGYLLKDILELDRIKGSLFIFNLLRLIAFQVGKDISFSELGSNLRADSKTVMRYLELLEKAYVIFSLHGFSRNIRKEYTKSPRYYFWDNGIRNSLISNYNRLGLRDDIGILWENFCISERLKRNHYRNISSNYFFWRTYDQKEIDLIEEKQGAISGFEFKWKESRSKSAKIFVETYKNSTVDIIHPQNYLDFIS